MFTRPCGWWIIFRLQPTDEALLAFRYSIASSIIKYPDELHLFFPSVQTFTARVICICRVNSTLTFRSKVGTSTQTASSPDLSFCGTESRGDAYTPATILPSSYRGSTFIYPTYLHNVHFFSSSHIAITTNSFSNPLSWVKLGPCVGWIIVLKNKSMLFDCCHRLMRVASYLITEELAFEWLIKLEWMLQFDKGTFEFIFHAISWRQKRFFLIQIMKELSVKCVINAFLSFLLLFSCFHDYYFLLFFLLLLLYPMNNFTFPIIIVPIIFMLLILWLFHVIIS